MNLPQYIAQIGDKKAAKLFGVTQRAAMSWRLRDRVPRIEQAQRIIKKSPVNWDGIYGPHIEPAYVYPRAK